MKGTSFFEGYGHVDEHRGSWGAGGGGGRLTAPLPSVNGFFLLL